MRIPRVSVQTIMALVIVVAADCLACRAVAIRPGGMTAHFNLILLNSLPMTNLLAIGAAFWIRGRRTFGSFWAGFVGFGLVALVGSNLWLGPILAWWETTLTSAGLVAWVGNSAIRELVALYGLLAAVLAFPQVLVASIGGGLNRLIGMRSTWPAEVAGPRRQVAALGAMVALVVFPALSVDAYLRLTVDRKIARLPVNSEAVVIDEQVQKMLALLPPTRPGMSAIFAIGAAPPLPNGTRVRVESDAESSIVQGVQDSRGGAPSFGDYRIVRAILLDGDQQGKPVELPRCALNPTHTTK
jgi:hypothetical protein